MDSDFLDALLGYVCHDVVFCRAYGHLFDLEDFSTRAVADHAERETLAKAALDNWRAYGEPIGDQLRAAMELAAKKQRLPDSRRLKLLGYAKRVYGGERTAPDSIGARYLEFKREALLGRAMDEFGELYAAQELTLAKFGTIIEKTNTLEARLSPPAVSMDDSEDLETRITSRENFRHQPGYWTLINPLDELLERPPRKGYFCLGLGLAKFGKSTFLSHLAISGVMQGAKVLYLTLEDSKDIVDSRHDSILTGIPMNQLYENSARVRQANHRFWSSVRGKLKVIDGTGAKWLVSDIEAAYLREREQGFDADIVIVDYYLELESVQQHREFRWKSDEISRDLRRFAAKRNVLLWTAHQSAINADTVGAKVLGIDKAAEDRGLARKVHLMIGFGQGDWDMTDAPKHLRNLYLNISASKFTQSHVGCNIISDFSRGLFYHSEETARRERQMLIRQADEAAGGAQ